MEPKYKDVYVITYGKKVSKEDAIVFMDDLEQDFLDAREAYYPELDDGEPLTEDEIWKCAYDFCIDNCKHTRFILTRSSLVLDGCRLSQVLDKETKHIFLYQINERNNAGEFNFDMITYDNSAEIVGKNNKTSDSILEGNHNVLMKILQARGA